MPDGISRIHEVELLLPGEGLVHVVACPNPFRVQRVSFTVEAGCTLADILEKVQPDPALRRFYHVAIGDSNIADVALSRIRPKPGTRVTVRMLPGKKKAAGGGGGGGKNPLATILSIVTVIAAIAIPPLAVGMLGLAAGSTAALVTGGLLAGGIMMAGGMLANALAPPSKPKLAALSAPLGGGGGGLAQQDKESPTLSISGARNDLRPYSPVAVVLGRHWQVPALGAPTYTEVVGADQYLRMVVVWGVGPLNVYDHKIGETSLMAFQDVQREFKRGYQASQIIDRGPWNASGGVWPTDPAFGHRWTIADAGAISGSPLNPGDTITFNNLARAGDRVAWDVNEDKLFSLFPYDAVEATEQIVLGMDWQMRTTAPDTDQISFDLVYFRGLTSYAPDGRRQATEAVMFAEYAPTGTQAWVEIGYISTVAASSEVVRTGRIFNVTRGQYDVRWKRVTPISTETTLVNECAMTALRSFKIQPPFDHRGIPGSTVALCCEAFRIRATDQLQGVIDTMSGICHMIAPDWNGQAWVTRMTDNPASIFRHVFQGPGNPIPLKDSEVDLPTLQHWHEFCSAKNFMFSHIVDYASSVQQIAEDVAAAARASPASRDNKQTVVIDEPATVPVQVFTPRNSWGFRSEISYPELPHAYRVRFVSAETGKGLETVVYDDGYSAENATLFEVLQPTGVTTHHHAFKWARYQLAVARLRRQSPSFYADFEAIVCTRGDLIRFTHDVPLWGLKSGRVIDVIKENTSVTAVALDEPVQIEAGKSYTIRFRRASSVGMEQFATVTPRIGEQTIVAFSAIAPVGGEDAVRIGDLFWFGETGQEHRDLRVHAIVDPSPEYSMRIICVEDNNAIYGADQTAIPPYDPGLSTGASILYPRIISVRSDGSVVFHNANGGYDNRILIAYALPSGTMATQIAGVEAQFKRQNDQNFSLSPIAGLVTGDISLTNVEGRETYDFMLRFVRKDGTRGMWSPVETHTVIANDNVPPDVPYFVVTRMPDGTRRFEWFMVLEPEDVVSGGGYIIKYQSGTSFDWSTATSIFTAGYIRGSPWEMNDVPAGTWTFGIKAVTASGMESTSPRTMTIELGDPRMRDVLMQQHEHLLGWPGTLTDCFKWGSNPRHLYAGAAGGSRWDSQNKPWSEMGTWNSLPRITPISYTTTVYDPGDGVNLTFTPRVDVEADGAVSVEMRAGTVAGGTDLSGNPWGPLAQVIQCAYVQFRVTADGPRIRQMIVSIDGAVGVDDIEDINTSTSTATYFQRLGTGWFRVATRKPIAVITSAQIVAIQTSGNNWTWRLRDKTAAVAGNSAPAAEFELFNGTIPTDALVDIELKGPLQ